MRRLLLAWIRKEQLTSIFAVYTLLKEGDTTEIVQSTVGEPRSAQLVSSIHPAQQPSIRSELGYIIQGNFVCFTFTAVQEAGILIS